MSALRQLRRRALLSGKQLADRVGVSRATISGWENGTSWPQPQHIPTLAKVLGVELAQLFEALEADRKQDIPAA